jgi:alpha/beta superfamily hydrolase
MISIEKLSIPGEHPFFFQSQVGPLEGILTVPNEVELNYLAILGHPHSLQGGSMNNKVITTMARAYKELGIPSMRFNFRGVGNSAGIFDAGIGESEDILLFMQLWQKQQPNTNFFLNGFSFGSYVAYRCAAQSKIKGLLTIAPPVHHFNYREFSGQPNPWYIFQGDEDDIVPLHYVLDFAKESSPVIPVIHFAKTGHFFHGNLITLKSELIAVIGKLK